MDASEVCTSAVAVDGCSVYSIFESVFDEAMNEFKNPLDVLKKNEYSFAWKTNSERHKKTMVHARKFVDNVIQRFRSKHGDVAVAVEGGACEAFQEYFTNRLNADGAENMLEETLREIKVEFTRKISMVKESLEKEKGKQPKPKSVIEKMIWKTDLFDPIHIHHVLLCCRVAQKCEDLENPGKCLNELGEKHLLSEIIVSYENDDVPKYLMARCGDVLYVTFGGLHFTKIGCSKRDWRGQICQGINAEAQKIPLGYFAKEIYQKRRIIFSGHSTGGTIAALVVIYLLDKFKQLPPEYLQSKLKCITLGLLPVGDETLKKYVESIPGVKDCFNHIVKKDDIVPSLCGENWNRVQETCSDAVKDIPNPLCYFDNENALEKLSSSCRRLFRWVIDRGIISIVLPTFDVFGMYYILDPTANDGHCKYKKLTAEKAKACLTLDQKSVIDIWNAHLTNHRLERYDHEVRMCLIEIPPHELEEFPSFEVKKPTDILPKVSEVTFENIGDQVVAKITGSSMWFVYRVSIENDIDLPVDSIKTRESEVQLTMPKSHISHTSNVSVRVKTHFHNAKYLKAKRVTARIMTYNVSRRQEQLAKLSPCDVIELAYLSALLERRSVESDSKRYEDIKTFFEAAVSVVPIESLFHAMATGSTHTIVQCCELFLCGNDLIPPTEPSQFLQDGTKEAIKNIRAIFGQVDTRRTRGLHGRKSSLYPLEGSSNDQLCISSESVAVIRQVSSRRKPQHSSRKQINDGQGIVIKTKKTVFKAVDKMKKFSNSSCRNLTSLQSKCLCGKNLESIYPSSEVNVNDNKNGKPNCCKTPMTLLISGRNKLDIFSERTTLNVESNGDTDSNTLMLQVLNDLRQDFETCSTLLGAFMEAQVQVPLEMQGNKCVDFIAKTAKSFGLDVWGLLILPFHDLQGVIESLAGSCLRRLIVEVAGSMYGLYDLFTARKRHFGNYEGKLEFLLTSMKQSSVSNREFVTYSLERQLDEQCKKRNISSTTPLDEILQQWQANFQDETLTLVPDRFRPLVARWIKWSLMINRLRESIAEQTAVGVIGLVNSGKSKFVRSIFGIKAITGTTALKRTTVPFIYNLEPQIKGLDVIDFPGVDDQDKSIPELAKLLLSLTRLVVFVVDYKRAHTESTKEWLGILEKENVPVLICLSFADKLYAELMGEEGNRDADDLKDEIAAQLKNIKDQIGQPEIGTRDFKFVVFAFDNDSKLNCEDSKDKLRQAGLNDELDVGQWIAEKLEENEQSELSQEILKFIEEKKTSTLNFHKMRKAETES